MNRDPDPTDRLVAAIRDALARLDPDSLADLHVQAIRQGRTLEEQAVYRLAAHRGMVPIDPGDRDAADFAMLHRRMTQNKRVGED